MDAFEIYADPSFVGRYTRQVQGIDHPGFYERRATLSLLPPLRGQRVLDAGCGPGVYSLWLAQQGAEVTALDYSPAMLEMLRKQAGRRSPIRLLQADLSGPLPLPNQGFDLILCAMVLQHLRDWAPVLQEFRRLLAPGGRLVLSTTHPFADLLPETDYFSLAETGDDWPAYGVVMPCWRRSFSQIFADLHQAGLVLDQLLEPRAVDPDPFIANQPWVLCLSLRADY
ncbi:MAG: class I SAM-dependent methyltransferase [Candidatus Sericytochromatia bacterium]